MELVVKNMDSNSTPNQKKEFAHIVGKRRMPQPEDPKDKEFINNSIEHSNTMFKLSGICYMPKGVFRFKSHEESNAVDMENLAKSMALLNIQREKTEKEKDK